MKRLTDRLRRWVVCSVVAAVAGSAAIVAAAYGLHALSADPAPPVAAQQPRAPPPPSPQRAASRGLLAETLATAAVPAPTQAADSALPFIWPADGVVSQAMTRKHPSGIDIAATTGSEVRAARDGVVFFAGGDPCCSYGNYIVLAHDGGWTTVYGHLSKFLVKAGDPVKQGQAIGLSGDTGYVDGAHLHFELRSSGRPVNPLDHLWPPRPLLPEEATPTPEAAAAPTPTPTSAGLLPQEATALAIDWMARNESYAYAIDASTCYAMQRAVNWLVTCEGTLQGCQGGACQAFFSACVLDQPRLIAKYCP